MCIFNWTTRVQKGHMSVSIILHNNIKLAVSWQEKKNSFLEDCSYLRSAAVSTCN